MVSLMTLTLLTACATGKGEVPLQTGNISFCDVYEVIIPPEPCGDNCLKNEATYLCECDKGTDPELEAELCAE